MDIPSYPNKPFSPAKWPFFYGWTIIGMGTLGMLMSVPGQTIGVSTFTESLIKALALDRDQLSLAYMGGTIASALMLPWVGRLYDTMGARRIAIGASIFLGTILLYLSQLDRIIAWIGGADAPFLLVMFLTFVGFLFLRFFGQGVLTLASRNMMMKWFENRRGFATGFSNVFVSLGFSSAPVIIEEFIIRDGWRGAWINMALIVGILFPIVVFVFYRDNPEACGLQPDGQYEMSEKRKKSFFPIRKQFTLKEAIRTYPFWIFGLMMALQGLYITGFTFNVVSIFKEVGMDREVAISIFQPSAVIAVIITLAVSALSDIIKLKYLLYLKAVASCTSAIGVIFLGSWESAYYLLILGNGLMSGLFSVLVSVTWPRLFGRMHLGAISGQATMLIVLGSSVGPIIFSASLSQTGSYDLAAWFCFGLYALLGISSIKADNPQEKLKA